MDHETHRLIYQSVTTKIRGWQITRHADGVEYSQSTQPESAVMGMVSDLLKSNHSETTSGG